MKIIMSRDEITDACRAWLAEQVSVDEEKFAPRWEFDGNEPDDLFIVWEPKGPEKPCPHYWFEHRFTCLKPNGHAGDHEFSTEAHKEHPA